MSTARRLAKKPSLQIISRSQSISKRKAPEAINGILTQALKSYGIDRDIARYQFVQHWNEIVGDEIAKRSRPECFREGALVVRVLNSSWAQELSFHKEVILNRLRKFIDQDEVVNDIQFYVGVLR